MKRLLASLLSLAAILFGTGTAAHAQSDAYPPRSLAVTQNVDQVAPGGVFAVTLTGCIEGESIDFVFAGDRQSLDCDLTAGPQALVASDVPLGGATARLTAPATTGRFVGTVSLNGGRTVGDFEISVVDDPADPVSVNAQTPNAAESTAGPESDSSSSAMILFFGFAIIAAIAVFILRPQFA